MFMLICQAEFILTRLLITLENLCTRKVQSSRGGLQSTSAQNSVASCLIGLYFGQYLTYENIHREILSLVFLKK